MKTLIIYASKHGTTKQCAQIIHNNRKGDLHHIRECENLKPIDYDVIYIGSPVYAGRINKKIKQWIERYIDDLKNKQSIVFLSGMNPDGLDEVIHQNFSDDIAKTLQLEHVGGAFKFDDMNMFEKFIVKVVAKETSSVDNVNYNKVKEL
ncbi:MAG: flavodoxin domain-containing protein [Candidatus Izemoplasma sp.]|nr:flavodoxin domain-containing protein [Candidatus Izemoplasma sp.]